MNSGALIGLVAGALLGFLSSYLLARYKQRADLGRLMVEQYLQSREELCGILSRLASLEVTGGDSTSGCLEIAAELSKLYYLHYDILPVEVLRSLNCLYACLVDRDNAVYKCDENRLLPMSEHEIVSVVESVSLVDNYKESAPFFLLGPDASRRRAAAINLQARIVLQAMNRYYGLQEFV